LNITIAHLHKSFLVHHRLKNLFDDLSFSITFQHVLALLGPSGGGKTTLLRILAGLEIPESGSLTVDGKNVRFDTKSLYHYRQKLGVVFQQQNLFPHLTALENVMLPLTVVQRLEHAVAKKKAEEILDQLQLSAHQHQKPHQLSGGQGQRVAIARALITRPQFLLFDEPTSSLDPEMKSEVLELIAQLRSFQIPLVLVTHEMEFAKKCADQVIYLANGKMIDQGATKHFFSHPKTEELKRFLELTRGVDHLLP
jgi:polar amino acid transport system ATP-binding protein